MDIYSIGLLGQISDVSEKIHRVLRTEPGSYVGHQSITVQLNSPGLDKMMLKLSTKLSFQLKILCTLLWYNGLSYCSSVFGNSQKF